MAASPLAHVHCLVAHWRFCDALGATVWYSAPVHVVHAAHAPYPVLSEYLPVVHAAHCDACCSLLVSSEKVEPRPGPHVT